MGVDIYTCAICKDNRHSDYMNSCDECGEQICKNCAGAPFVFPLPWVEGYVWECVLCTKDSKRRQIGDEEMLEYALKLLGMTCEELKAKILTDKERSKMLTDKETARILAEIHESEEKEKSNKRARNE